MSTTAERLSAALADRYRIERELGAGGMATVYLAQDGSRFVIVRDIFVHSPRGDLHLMVNCFPELRRLFDRAGGRP